MKKLTFSFQKQNMRGQKKKTKTSIVEEVSDKGDKENSKEKRRFLTEEELDFVTDFIQPNPYISKTVANQYATHTRESMKNRIRKNQLYPSLIPQFKEIMRKQYYNSLISSGESVGIIMAQSIGEKQTQSNLNTFHKAGSSDKQPVVSKFSELVNVTNKPKNPSFFVHFKTGNDTIEELRETIGHKLIHIDVFMIAKKITCIPKKKKEPWYEVYSSLYDKFPDYSACLVIDVNMDILYEYKLSLEEIATLLNNEYSDSYTIPSPDCFARLDVFVNTSAINPPENIASFITEDNKDLIFLEEVVQPIFESIRIAGISNVSQFFFLKDGNNKWYVETENGKNRMSVSKKFKKASMIDSVKRYKEVLALDIVDATKTVSNNVWDIYHVLGIEAVRQYMIEQFCAIMKGINICHVSLLVDGITRNGVMASVSRYTMRKAGGPFTRATFEETFDNFLTAGAQGQEESTDGVSASVICGKQARIGTGFCDLVMRI